MFLKDSVLENKHTAHGFFGRTGGVSEGLYKSLNCGLGTPDGAVPENRAIAAKALGIMPEKLLSLYQTHSDKCMVVTKPWQERPHADAMVTDMPGWGLAVLTADCAPVLFYGEKADGSPVIGAAHAGWGGALRGVLENTVTAMEELGAGKGTLRAVVGPCIAQRSYEVMKRFKEPFAAQDQANEMFFSPAGCAEHLMFDLPGYIVRRLMLAGVPEISVSGADTYFNELDYFSYRRSVHRGEPDYGRQISIISIES
jgi:polyphenol oxidase